MTKTFIIQATVTEHRVPDWSVTRQIPTFYLIAMNEKHAKQIAEEILNSAQIPIVEFSITVMDLAENRLT